MALHRAGSTETKRLFLESVNSRMRDAFLNETLLRNLAHSLELVKAWGADYNSARPHWTLGDQPAAGFAMHLTTAITRLAACDESFTRGRLLNPRQKAQMTCGFYSWMDEGPFACQRHSTDNQLGMQCPCCVYRTQDINQISRTHP